MTNSRYAFVAMLALAALLAHELTAQASNPLHSYMGHVMESWSDTPEGAGILPTMMAEAEIAARHARFPTADPSDIAAMKSHAGHLLHTLDPETVGGGPSKGYGLSEATEAAATHTRLADEADGDGQVSWREGEGGLAKARRHMAPMYEAEGLSLQ